MEKINNLKELERFAKTLASRLKPGDVLGLEGELGSGKTALVKFLGKSLKVKKPINSPTYLIKKIYPIDKNCQLVHIDAYRLVKNERLENVDFPQLLEDGKSIIVIEWADKVKKSLPSNTTWLKLKIHYDGSRSIYSIHHRYY